MISLRGRAFNFFYKKYLNLFGRFIPTKGNEKNIRELKTSVRALLFVEKDNDVVIPWIDNQKMLKDSILKDDISNFLQWQVITNTMFSNCNYLEFSLLINSKHWKILRKGIQEDFIGNPSRYHSFPLSSGNLLHHAFSLLQLINKIGINKFLSIRSVFEFGGGYGSFCRLLYRILPGINRYNIYDLEIFTFLQYYFLRSINLPISIFLNKKNQDSDGIYLFNKELGGLLQNRDLFIALWSLSEIPLLQRKNVVPVLMTSKVVLIAFQKEFDGMDNEKYFKSIMKELTSHHWYIYESKELPGNFYLIGEKH